MATEKQPKQQPKSNWTPPRGIRYAYRAGQPKPYYLHWTDKKTGKRTAEAFSAPEDREQKAMVLVDNIKQYGEDTSSYSPLEWRKWMEFKEGAKGTDPMVILHYWQQGQQGSAPVQSKKVSEAVTEYMRLRDLEKCWDTDTRRHIDKQLRRFVLKFGTLHLHEVDKNEVRNWLYSLKDDDGKKLGNHAINHHRKTLNQFFKCSITEGWGTRENPCTSIKALKIENADPIVIPLKDAFDFFKANRDDRVAARVALEAFAVIRKTTVGLIDKDALNIEAKGIRMKASIHKTGKKDGRSRYRQGHPDNLWQWIEHAPESTWSMSAQDYQKEKGLAFIKAGLKPVANTSAEDKKKTKGLRNIWRHSYISYHLAAFRNPANTQYLAQHKDLQQTEDYEGIADHEDGLRYFMITPETVKLSWEEFIKLPLPDGDDKTADNKTTTSQKQTKPQETTPHEVPTPKAPQKNRTAKTATLPK